MSWEFVQGDVLHLPLASASVDLVFCSPPYEDAREYGIGFSLRGKDWVDWAVQGFQECLRVCRGLVAWVVAGKTKQFRWSATPALLLAALHEQGVNLRKPPAFHRVGIAGSGGPDWLRNDYDFIVCATADPGKLPWSDNTAMGHPPKWAPGGDMSHRLSDGYRVNQWGHSYDSGGTVVDKRGVVRSKKFRPSHREHTKRRRDGEMEVQKYRPPVLANPGNVIKCNVGGGVMGHPLAHENEAPFPQKLAEFFVRSFCPPGGIVCDPFSGSGTTVAAASECGRHGIGIDIRMNQCELGQKRIKDVRSQMELFATKD